MQRYIIQLSNYSFKPLITMKSTFRLFMLFMAVSLFEGCITIQVSPDASSAKAVRDDLYDSSIRTSSVNKKPKKSDYIDLDDESTFVEEEEEQVTQSPTFLNSRSVYQNNYNEGFSDGFRNGAFVSSPWNNWYSNPFLSFGISFGNRWASPLNSFNDPFFGGFSSPFSNFGFFGGFNSFNMGYMNPYNDPFLMNRMVRSSFFGGGFGGFGFGGFGGLGGFGGMMYNPYNYYNAFGAGYYSNYNAYNSGYYQTNQNGAVTERTIRRNVGAREDRNSNRYNENNYNNSPRQSSNQYNSQGTNQSRQNSNYNSTPNSNQPKSTSNQNQSESYSAPVRRNSRSEYTRPVEPQRSAPQTNYNYSAPSSNSSSGGSTGGGSTGGGGGSSRGPR